MTQPTVLTAEPGLVHMTSWARARVTLCGDAGYCASPLKCQDLPRGVDGYAPMTESHIAITAAVMK